MYIEFDDLEFLQFKIIILKIINFIIKFNNLYLLFCHVNSDLGLIKAVSCMFHIMV